MLIILLTWVLKNAQLSWTVVTWAHSTERKSCEVQNLHSDYPTYLHGAEGDFLRSLTEEDMKHVQKLSL